MVGMVQYKILVQWAPRLFGLTHAVASGAPLLRRNICALRVVAFDQLCFLPLFYLPIFFVMREIALNTESLPGEHDAVPPDPA